MNGASRRLSSPATSSNRSLPSPFAKKRTKSELIKERLSLIRPVDSGDDDGPITDHRYRTIDPETARLLHQLAIGENGLVSDEYRRAIWPILSRVSAMNDDDDDDWDEEEQQHADTTDVDEEEDRERRQSQLLRNHPEYRQVEMDVHRTLARFPPHIDDQDRTRLQHQLTPIVVRILRRHPRFRYYQGFHDVCLTVLLVIENAEDAYRICDRLARAHFRQFLEKPLDVATESLYLMYPLIKRVDPELYEFLYRSQVGVMFALSWQLTWFAHVIDDYASIVRLYDLFFASHPLMPIYFAASLILYRSPDILALECEMAPVHGFLSKPPTNLPIEALISDALDLFVEHPPSKLKEMHVALKKEQERVARLRQLRKRRASWPLLFATAGGGENARKKVIKLTFWTVTAAAAAWYFYTHSPFRVI